MSEKLDFSQIQKRIRKAACEAAKTGDFSGLGQAVGETMDDAADEVRRQVGRMQENCIRRHWNRRVRQPFLRIFCLVAGYPAYAAP